MSPRSCPSAALCASPSVSAANIRALLFPAAVEEGEASDEDEKEDKEDADECRLGQ